jgi:hypothetical protein
LIYQILKCEEQTSERVTGKQVPEEGGIITCQKHDVKRMLYFVDFQVVKHGVEDEEGSLRRQIFDRTFIRY